VSNVILSPYFVCFALKILVFCRPILLLPPADVQVIYCELTEAEKDFYEALFRRSKVSSHLRHCFMCFVIDLRLSSMVHFE
jgi:hypothetical protein